jgi:hypothetical protein
MSSSLASGRLPALAKETPVRFAAGDVSSKAPVRARLRRPRAGARTSYPSFTAQRGERQPVRDPLETSPHVKTEELEMDQHALLMYTLMRHQRLDLSEPALRRETLARFELEAREARRRRRRALVRRTLSGFSVVHRDAKTRLQPGDSPAVGEASS